MKPVDFVSKGIEPPAPLARLMKDSRHWARYKRFPDAKPEHDADVDPPEFCSAGAAHRLGADVAIGQAVRRCGDTRIDSHRQSGSILSQLEACNVIKANPSNADGHELPMIAA